MVTTVLTLFVVTNDLNEVSNFVITRCILPETKRNRRHLFILIGLLVLFDLQDNAPTLYQCQAGGGSGNPREFDRDAYPQGGDFDLEITQFLYFPSGHVYLFMVTVDPLQVFITFH